MKKIALFISAVFILAFLFGCNAEKTMPVDKDVKITDEKTVNIENEENTDITDDEAANVTNEEKTDTDNETENEAKLVTKEQIMEYFDFSEEELEGIDVDAVIEYCGFTEDELKNFSKKLFLMSLETADEKMRTDIGYLFKGGQPDGKIPVSQIKTVAFLEAEDIESYYWHISVQDKKAYYCFGYSENMDLEKECRYSKAITDDYINELLNSLENANLHKWKAGYRGNNGETTGSWGWHLGIELTDGTVYSWWGSGMFGNNKPEEFESVESGITSVFTGIKLN